MKLTLPKINDIWKHEISYTTKLPSNNFWHAYSFNNNYTYFSCLKGARAGQIVKDPFNIFYNNILKYGFKKISNINL